MFAPIVTFVTTKITNSAENNQFLVKEKKIFAAYYNLITHFFKVIREAKKDRHKDFHFEDILSGLLKIYWQEVITEFRKTFLPNSENLFTENLFTEKLFCLPKNFSVYRKTISFTENLFTENLFTEKLFCLPKN